MSRDEPPSIEVSLDRIAEALWAVVPEEPDIADMFLPLGIQVRRRGERVGRGAQGRRRPDPEVRGLTTWAHLRALYDGIDDARARAALIANQKRPGSYPGDSEALLVRDLENLLSAVDEICAAIVKARKLQGVST